MQSLTFLNVVCCRVYVARWMLRNTRNQVREQHEGGVRTQALHFFVRVHSRPLWLWVSCLTCLRPHSSSWGACCRIDLLYQQLITSCTYLQYTLYSTYQTNVCDSRILLILIHMLIYASLSNLMMIPQRVNVTSLRKIYNAEWSITSIIQTQKKHGISLQHFHNKYALTTPNVTRNHTTTTTTTHHTHHAPHTIQQLKHKDW